MNRSLQLRQLVTGKVLFSDGVLLSLLLVLAGWSFWPDRQIAADCLHSDAPDYILPSLNFLQGKGFVIMVEGHKYPPQHIFGLSLLMTPAYAVLGPHVGNGVYSIFLLGLGTVTLAYGLAKRLFDKRVAFITCLFLILADGLRWYSRIIATDGAASIFFCLAAHLVLLKVLQNPRSSPWVWLLLGQVVGFSMLVRPDNIFIVLPIGACLLAALRKREAGPGGILLAVGGIVFWLAVVLVANYLYTGNCLRSMYHVTHSEIYDRVGGSVSWRYLLNPSLQESNLGQMLHGAIYQWSSVEGDTDRVKRYFYLAANVFLTVGLVTVAIRSRKEKSKSSHLLVWMLLWAFPLMLFFSCSFNNLGVRVMLRMVPYLCILDAVGVVTLWDLAGQWRSRLSALLHQFRTTTLAQPSSWVERLPLQIMFGAVMIAWGGYVFFHPYCDPWAWMPVSAFLGHVDRLIPENDAVVISNCNPFYAEHFLISNSARMLLPLHGFTSGVDYFVQWKKPPHPEWINEDYPDRSIQWLSVAYKRMRENGARFIFPNTAFDNPEIIEGALRAGRKVYFVGQTVFTDIDVVVLNRLTRQADLQMIMEGFEPSYEIPAQSRPFLRKLCVMRVAQLHSLESKWRFPPEVTLKIDEMEKKLKEAETEPTPRQMDTPR